MYKTDRTRHLLFAVLLVVIIFKDVGILESHEEDLSSLSTAQMFESGYINETVSPMI
jgi:hypothetical protein